MNALNTSERTRARTSTPTSWLGLDELEPHASLVRNTAGVSAGPYRHFVFNKKTVSESNTFTLHVGKANASLRSLGARPVPSDIIAGNNSFEVLSRATLEPELSSERYLQTVLRPLVGGMRHWQQLETFNLGEMFVSIYSTLDDEKHSKTAFDQQKNSDILQKASDLVHACPDIDLSIKELILHDLPIFLQMPVVCSTPYIFISDDLLTMQWKNGNDGVAAMLAGDGFVSMAFKTVAMRYTSSIEDLRVGDPLPPEFLRIAKQG